MPLSAILARASLAGSPNLKIDIFFRWLATTIGVKIIEFVILVIVTRYIFEPLAKADEEANTRLAIAAAPVNFLKIVNITYPPGLRGVTI
jgi:hypothetical protein